MVDFIKQGEYAGKEIFYLSMFSLTPKRKVASPPGRPEDFARKEKLKKLPKIGNFN